MNQTLNRNFVWFNLKVYLVKLDSPERAHPPLYHRFRCPRKTIWH
uniref:Uncharacterized protein n=1 Tax=Podoviridae sp. ctXdu7 TaxID=2827618 RepID=A0A8S5RRK8_9CAUD|nr:MAG TPA: hypothetical protein [Podoviridae sp. ctXdu7]